MNNFQEETKELLLNDKNEK